MVRSKPIVIKILGIYLYDQVLDEVKAISENSTSLQDQEPEFHLYIKLLYEIMQCKNPHFFHIHLRDYQYFHGLHKSIWKMYDLLNNGLEIMKDIKRIQNHLKLSVQLKE